MIVVTTREEVILTIQIDHERSVKYWAELSPDKRKEMISLLAMVWKTDYDAAEMEIQRLYGQTEQPQNTLQEAGEPDKK